MAIAKLIKEDKDNFLVALDYVIQPDIKNYKATSENKITKAKGNFITVKKNKLKSTSLHAKNFLYSSIDTVESVRTGIEFKSFKSFFDMLHLTTKKWSEILGVSEKTMQTILKDKKFLEQRKSEKLLSFLLLVKYGIEVFGSQNSFEEWLKYKTPMLLGNAPIDYLDTIQGVEMLQEQIFRIETGNLA